MFCRQCGAKLEDGGMFCPQCGAKIEDKSTDKKILNITEVMQKNQKSKKYSQNDGESIEKKCEDDIKPYYREEFERIASGQKIKFNWAAFFLNGFLQLYHGCTKIFCRTFLPVWGILYISVFLGVLGTMKFDFKLISISLILGLLVGVCNFILCIVSGARFNKWYYQEVISNPEKQRNRKEFWVMIVVHVLLIASISLSPRLFISSDNAFENCSYAGQADMQIYNQNIDLSETYINEEEGILFNYPSAWVDVTEYYTNEQLEFYVVGLANVDEDVPELGSVIEIRKFTDSQYLIDQLFISDKEFIDNFSEGQNEISDIRTSVVEIDGVPARNISYVGENNIFYQSYIYNVDSDLYWIDFMCEESQAESYEHFFSAIIGSYSITSRGNTNDIGFPDMDQRVERDFGTNYASEGSNMDVDICFNNIAIENLLNASKEELILQFGNDYTSYEDGGISYFDFGFYMRDDKTVEYIWSSYPEFFSINGNNLETNDVGIIYKDEIIELLGGNYKDEYLSDRYYMTYEYSTYMLSFGINKYGEVIDVRVSNLNVEKNNLFSNFSGDMLGYEKPVENYAKLAGYYVGEVEAQDELYLNIYSSQEEGVIEIGNAKIYREGMLCYSGIVVPIEPGIYQVVDEMEVFLVESSYEDMIILQLYVDGEYVDAYRMEEHYVS